MGHGQSRGAARRVSRRHAEIRQTACTDRAEALASCQARGLNRGAEIAGFRDALEAGLDVCAPLYAARTEVGDEFEAIRTRDGLKAALAWRRAQFKEEWRCAMTGFSTKALAALCRPRRDECAAVAQELRSSPARRSRWSSNSRSAAATISTRAPSRATGRGTFPATPRSCRRTCPGAGTPRRRQLALHRGAEGRHRRRHHRAERSGRSGAGRAGHPLRRSAFQLAWQSDRRQSRDGGLERIRSRDARRREGQGRAVLRLHRRRADDGVPARHQPADRNADQGRRRLPRPERRQHRDGAGRGELHRRHDMVVGEGDDAADAGCAQAQRVGAVGRFEGS